MNDSKNLWVGVGKQIMSFVVGVIATAFILGSARQRINDLVAWKAEVAPRIERMDSRGTLSFEHFHQAYTKDQERTEKRFDKLEREIEKK